MVAILRVAVMRFPYDPELIVLTRGLTGAGWSQQMGCWHIPDDDNIFALLYKTYRGKAFLDYSALKSPVIAEKGRQKREEEER